jgi:tripartite-type tricarboxylate transporter receptor subunit TctC
MRNATLFGLLLYAGTTCAQPYPSKAVRLVVPFPPGASNDVIARLVAQKLGENLRQTMVIDNRGGAGGAIGAEIVARSPPDGYTLLATSTTYTTNFVMQAKPAFDALNDMIAVAMFGKAPMLVTVHPALPAKSVRDLIALATAQPDKINYASSGNGSAPHFVTERFKSEARITMTHVPYKGLGPALNDLVGGQTQVLIASLPSVMPQVKATRLRALAVTSLKRSAFVPELPTADESGLRGFTSELWWGLLAPARMREPIVEQLNSEVRRLLANDDIKQRLAFEGAEAAPMSPREFSTYLRDEIIRWRQVVKTSGIKIE